MGDGQTPQGQRLRLLADDLVAVLDAQTPHLIATSSRDEWERACLYGRTATGLASHDAIVFVKEVLAGGAGG
ncbi:hypothetical protein [Mangrovihabitans endophyticus]|uniref:hypothetical protein n=1 Tax=Mangrovihabitans endophyticus TaxID=1751298 RepID=UPI001E40B4CD|nr:hypothetical protein [Mangrovihabitans endophyticus]